MTYLSRVWLNPLRTRAQALLRSPENMHAAILGGLAVQPVTERVLWRLETREPHRAELLILTESRPSWVHLVEQAGWPGADGSEAMIRDYQPLLDRLQHGREFAFRLRANPVTATRHPTNPSVAQKEHLAAARPRGVRLPHRTAAHQLTWLTSRIDRWGFTLLPTASGPAVALTARERLTFSKKARAGEETGTRTGNSGQPGAQSRGKEKDRRQVVLSTATFDGALRVTDPELARRTLLHGVGPAKAYGCGLLTLAPLAHPRPAAEG
ncbi:type I-E CRISPR-associated protein Cas6/Cse3/CasE [Frankia sp. R82]|uniref:type I-E CRISPR-associated protein Cas6/Cse3/CasE n=1 Tax=Frankia sp. R82 TaxID=2950553 RepID=UPI0020439F0A|nr:type I-E CRISPR-associated protein Cas6/Cse3/CasE [Frankia sp. R82]MCM3884608.1 type I-E CRISPR-associated protein Cas6/Cse3/CasE [Frankia sp. R82]